MIHLRHEFKNYTNLIREILKFVLKSTFNMKRRTILRGATLLPFFNNLTGASSPSYVTRTTSPCHDINNDMMLKKIIKPKRLKLGDTLAMIAPSGPLTDENFEKSVKSMTDLGFKVKLGKYVREQKGYLAGTDAQRAEDFHWAFSDKTVDAVWCFRGGYGGTRVLPLINFNIGYSDITAYHLPIFQKTGLVTFHGPVGTSDYVDFTKNNALNVLMNPTPQYKLESAAENIANPSSLFKMEVITAGRCHGKLIGGNLSLLSAMAGTPYGLRDKDVKGKILFIEDIEERPYRVDRMLTQMLQAVDLRSCAGIALGVFEGCSPKKEEQSQTVQEVLKDRLGNLGIPVAYGLSFGHIKHQYTLPVGVEAAFDTEGGVITLLESGVL
jgi:muramoyltetrapeptide carboxypeptidase